MQVFLNGKFVDENEAKISVFDHGFLCGDGIYETMRTYGGKLWNFSGHFKRFQKSAEFLLLQIEYSEVELRKIVEQLLSRNGFSESRIRITLTRGNNSYDFSESKKPTLCVTAVELLVEPNEVFSKGVDVVTVLFHRVIPEVKSISLIAMVRAQQIAKKKKAYEALLVNERGYVTEGSRTNAYFVMRGAIFVPETDMLAGTTREILLQMAGHAGYEVVFKDCSKEAFYEADEIFLSNAIRGVVPVKSIDGFVVNEETPGPITKALMESWENKLKSFVDGK